MADESDERQTELDRLLNDPDVPMQAARIWELVDEIAVRAPHGVSARPPA